MIDILPSNSWLLALTLSIFYSDTNRENREMGEKRLHFIRKEQHMTAILTQKIRGVMAETHQQDLRLTGNNFLVEKNQRIFHHIDSEFSASTTIITGARYVRKPSITICVNEETLSYFLTFRHE